MLRRGGCLGMLRRGGCLGMLRRGGCLGMLRGGNGDQMINSPRYPRSSRSCSEPSFQEWTRFRLLLC